MTTETNRKGDVGELQVASTLLELGYVASRPMTETDYDLIVDLGDDGIKRVQVKVCRWSEDDNTYRVGFEKTHYTSDGANRKLYQDTDIDAYAVYNPDRSEVYWLWFGEAPKWGASRSADTWQKDLITEKLGR